MNSCLQFIELWLFFNAFYSLFMHCYDLWILLLKKYLLSRNQAIKCYFRQYGDCKCSSMKSFTSVFSIFVFTILLFQILLFCIIFFMHVVFNSMPSYGFLFFIFSEPCLSLVNKFFVLLSQFLIKINLESVIFEFSSVFIGYSLLFLF